MKAAARRPDKLFSDHDGLCGAGLCGAGKHSVPGPTRVFGTRVRETWTRHGHPWAALLDARSRSIRPADSISSSAG